MTERLPVSPYRQWLASRIHSMLARPSLHAASLAEAEMTLLTLMEAYVGAWSVDRGRSPERDVARVIGLWRASCHRLRGPGTDHPRLARAVDPSAETFSSDDVRRLTDGMGRVWEGVQAMCP